MDEQPKPVPTRHGRWRAADGRELTIYPDSVMRPEWHEWYRRKGPWVFVSPLSDSEAPSK